jgi:acyl-CoA thioester hydrolase
MYSKPFIAGWADMDFNAHMRNTAFLDRAADVRMLFFAEHGFEMKAFAERLLGPVIARDEVEYHREVGLLQPITVTLALAGLADDGSRFLMRNEVLGPDGRLCARIGSTGGWLDLAARRLVAPPPDLLAALATLERSEDFVVLPSSLRSDRPA